MADACVDGSRRTRAVTSHVSADLLSMYVCMYANNNIFSHPTPWQWRRCSRTPPPPRWPQTSSRARARSSIRCDITLRFDIAQPDVLTAAAAYLFDFMALQHHFHHHSGNFNPTVLDAAHLAIAPGSNARFRLLSPLDSRPRARFVPATPHTRACTHLCTGSFLISLIPASACMCLARAYPLFPVAIGHAQSMRTQRICRRYRLLACWFPALTYPPTSYAVHVLMLT